MSLCDCVVTTGYWLHKSPALSFEMSQWQGGGVVVNIFAVMRREEWCENQPS